MLWEAIAGQIDSADDGGNLLLDDPGQSPLFLHGVREEVNLVLKKLSIVAQSLEIVGQEAPMASDFFVDLPHLRAERTHLSKSQDLSHGRGGWIIDESRDAPQLEAALLFEYEMMRIETYSRQPDLMFHANDFRVGDRFQLGLDGCRTCARETEP